MEITHTIAIALAAKGPCSETVPPDSTLAESNNPTCSTFGLSRQAPVRVCAFLSCQNSVLGGAFLLPTARSVYKRPLPLSNRLICSTRQAMNILQAPRTTKVGACNINATSRWSSPHSYVMLPWGCTRKRL